VGLDRDDMLQRACGRVAGFQCWMVAVWYRNGSSVLGRERDIARIEGEHSDMDRNIRVTKYNDECSRA
jgi:hypothetical protein